jgi:hypothetical protein
MSRLSPALRSLFDEIVRAHRLELSDSFKTSGPAALDTSERERLIDVISGEFIRTGLQPDDEPNARGLQLEELLDWVLAHREQK